MSTTDFHCIECGDPISGGVSQSRCLPCIVGESNVGECDLCGASIPYAEDFCDDCQEELDEHSQWQVWEGTHDDDDE